MEEEEVVDIIPFLSGHPAAPVGDVRYFFPRVFRLSNHKSHFARIVLSERYFSDRRTCLVGLHLVQLEAAGSVVCAHAPTVGKPATYGFPNPIRVFDDFITRARARRFLSLALTSLMHIECTG